MTLQQNKYVAQVPELNLAENAEMLSDFSREAQRHLISSRNSLLVLESVPTDKESIENIFRTFHTIRGLADFLNLADIRSLTQETESMLNLVRKNVLSLDGDVMRLTSQSLQDLQKLLELLDEQISNEGKLTSPYHDVGPVINEIQGIISAKPSIANLGAFVAQTLPTISFEPDTTICGKLQQQLSVANDKALDKNLIQELLTQFQITAKELKEVQSKLQERQRELIKERELALKLTKQAQTEARNKSEYLANMSHEIRTLINAILGFTELLRESPLNIKQKEHLNTIILSGKMLLEIVNDILDYSKVEAGKLKIESIGFNLEDIVTDVFTIIRSRLVGKPINLFFDIDKTINPWLIGDPTRLKQIFINLLENAIKFTEKGEIGIIAVPDLSIKKAGQDSVIHFEVSDTGIGIPEDRKGAIFESYTQATDSHTRLYGGTGLGLTLCKNFVEKMGGKIWVETKLGKGSKFTFSIPFKHAKEPQSKGHLVALPSEIQNKEVLVVDPHDRSAENLLALSEVLKLKTLPRTRNPKQAIEILLQHKETKKPLPSIIFIDVMPSDKEGFNFAYKLKQQENYRQIKLIAISVDVRVDGSEDFQQAGFNDFLAKPILKKELANLLLRMFQPEVKGRRVVAKDTIEKISCEGIRVLVVEDSAPNQELLKVHFESLGCVCDYAGNGQEAIEKIQKSDYDICFMDLQMPVMGGIEAASIIHNQLKKKIPIVALTAAEIEEEKEKCLNAGMSDYLPKPFDLNQLKEKIIHCTKM